MNFPERRHLERTTPERPVYLDLRPDNGGIVLNVSNGGLCFQSVAPVRKHQSFAFSFREHSVGTDCVGEVVWTDESRKFGGLRFTRMSVEARDEVEEIARAVPTHNDEPLPALALVPFADESREITTALVPTEIGKASPLQVALLREANVIPAASMPTSATRSRRRWASRIPVAGLAIYAICVTIALYRYSRPHAPEDRVANQPELTAKTARALPANPVVTKTTGVRSSSPAKPPTGVVAVPHSNRKVVSKPAAMSPGPKRRPVITAAPVRFEYPVVANGAAAGRVELRLLISTSGSVQDVKVLSGNGALAGASIRAARRWRYRPLELNGTPTEAEAHVRLSFTGEEAVSVSFRD